MQRRTDLEKLMSCFWAGHENVRLANRYVIIPKPRKKRGGGVYDTISVLVKVPIPVLEGQKKLYKTSSVPLRKDGNLMAFIVEVRAVRDQLFKSVYGVDFCHRNIPRKKSVAPNTAGYDGVSLRESALEYRVSYLDERAERRFSYFSIVGRRSDEKAYLAACRFSDQKAGRELQSDEFYLAKKIKGISKEVLDRALKQMRELRAVKTDFAGTKEGVELCIRFGSLGFYVNDYNRDLGRSDRTLVSAQVFGENMAFVEACKLKDELRGDPILPDSEYMALKPNNLFGDLCAA